MRARLPAAALARRDRWIQALGELRGEALELGAGAAVQLAQLGCQLLVVVAQRGQLRRQLGQPEGVSIAAARLRLRSVAGLSQMSISSPIWWLRCPESIGPPRGWLISPT